MYIAWRVGYKIVTYDVTSTGVRRRNRLFCVCVAETVLLLLLLSILFCILLCWWCVKISKWTGPINVNLRFQTLCIILSFLSCLATQIHMLSTDPHVNNDFLFDFFSKNSLSCSRVGVCLNACLNKIPRF